MTIPAQLQKSFLHYVSFVLLWLTVLTASTASALTAQTITGFAPATPVLFSGGTFTLSATGGASGNPVAFSSGTTTICTVAGSTVTKVAVGTCTLRANQAGNATYSAAAQVSKNVVINKGTQTITFAAITGKGFGTAPFTVPATASSSLAVALTSTTTPVCTVSGSTVTLVALGTCTIAASQAGSTNYNAATQVTQSFTVAKGAQTITFAALAAKALGAAPFTISATASSGLTVALTSTTNAACTVAGTTVTLVSVGTCTIAANQVGNTNYNAAAQVTQSFTVSAAAKTNQTITFAAIANTALGTPLMLAGITATSGLTVAMTSATTTICTVSGFTVTLVATGTCTLRANQAGNASFNAAPQLSQSFTVLAAPNNKANQTIEGLYPSLPSARVDGGGQDIGIVYATSGLAVVATSSTPTVCSVENTRTDNEIRDGVPTIIRFFRAIYLATGTCTIRANQPGDATYNAAPQLSRSFSILPARVTVNITSPANNAVFAAPANIPISYTATALNGEPIQEIQYYRNGLLAISAPPTTPVTLQNLPVGTYTIKVSARIADNSGNSAGIYGSSKEITVTVVPPVYTVTLTSPPNGSTYMAPALITLAATATPTAPATNISRVDFYHGTTLIGTSTTPPFNYVWTGALAGGYRLTAVATDNLGVARTSAVGYVAVDSADTCINAPQLTAAESATRLAMLGKLPILFEENIGQIDGAVKFQARTPGFQLFLTENERVMVVQNQTAPVPRAKRDRALLADTRADVDTRSAAVRMSFVGANPRPVITGAEPSEQRSHYLIGEDTAKWRTDIRHFAKAHYQNIYPGIDEIYYGKEGKLEYDLRVAPGADPNVIRVAFKDVESISIDESGDLLLKTPLGTMVQKKPIAYQEIDGERHEVLASYKVDAANEVTFNLGNYDAAHTLVIDPVLVYSTLMGGSNSSGAYAIALSRCGEAYISGATRSPNFPTTQGALDVIGHPATVQYIGFISKLNAAGTGLVYSTYLAGANSADSASATFPIDIAVDGAGHAYVTGDTYDPLFPTTPGSAFSTTQEVSSAFVAKLNNSGNGLVYSSYLPTNHAYAIKVSGDGAAYIASGLHAYKMNPTGTALAYDMVIGYPNNPSTATSDAQAFSIAVDAAGYAYVAGTVTRSLVTTPGAFQATMPSSYSAGFGASGFVNKINLAGTGFVYSTYLGSTVDTSISDIAIDAVGNAYVVGGVYGRNSPPSYSGPVTVFKADAAAYPADYAFVAKLNASGSQLNYFSLLGAGNCADPFFIACQTANIYGSSTTFANSIAVDNGGNAWIAGVTNTSTTSATQLPLVRALPQFVGGSAFTVKLDSTGANVLLSTPLGEGNSVGSLAVDAVGSVYIAGTTTSANFPTTAGAFQRTPAAGSTANAFVLKINENKDTSTTLIVAPYTVSAGSTVSLTATITGHAPTGTVTFFDGATVLGASAVSSGIATLTRSFVGGIYSNLRAEYAGDTNNYPSSSYSQSLIVTDSNAYPAITLSGITDGASLVVDPCTPCTGVTMTVAANAAPGNTLSRVQLAPSGEYWLPMKPSFTSTYTLPISRIGFFTASASAIDNFNHATKSASIRYVVNAAGSTPPTLAITAPANGVSLRAPITFTVNAAATGGLNFVEYFLNDVSYGAGFLAPYSFTLNNAPAGTYSIIAKATDNLTGAVALSAPITITISPSISPPSAPILDGLFPYGSAVLLRYRTPSYIGGSAITGYSATCVAAGQPTVTRAIVGNIVSMEVYGLVGGITYSCTVAAINSFGVGAQSNSLTVIPEGAVAVIIIREPYDSATLRVADVNHITATAQSGSIALSRVEILVDGVSQGAYVPPVTPPTYAETIDVNWLNPALGSHSISAQMTNANGTVTNSTPVTVQVIDGPRVSLVSPSSFYLAPAAIDLLALATPPATPAGTTIAKVEYLNGASILATVTAPPYAYRWRNVAAGTYTITARVTDSNGVTSTSTTTTLTVGTSGSITPASGINGSTVNDNTVTFAGTFSAPPNASVTVNGQVATVTSDGRFFINDLVLQPGSNTLTLAINSPSGPITTQTITVTRGSTVAPFKLNVTPTQGLAPVATTLEVINPGAIAVGTVLVSCDNPSKNATSADVTTYATLVLFQCAYAKPGVYIPWAQVRNASGQALYESSKAVVVSDPLDTIAIVRGVYTNLIDQFSANNKAGALTNFFGHAQTKYDEIFTAMGTDLATFAGQLGSINFMAASDDLAEIIIGRDVNGVKKAFAIKLIRGEDGIWRIESM